jgi:8-oxo-dGTP pyrophosphatase MutT (NUDIX family)
MIRRLGFMLLWPGLFLYFLGSKRTRIMLLHNDEILLVQDRSRYFYDDESWTLPGGGIHRGEEITVAAAREVSEELGVHIEPDSLQLKATQKSGGYGLQYRAYFLVCNLPAKPDVHTQPNEVRSARWFKLSQANSLQLKREAQQGLQLLADKR